MGRSPAGSENGQKSCQPSLSAQVGHTWQQFMDSNMLILHDLYEGDFYGNERGPLLGGVSMEDKGEHIQVSNTRFLPIVSPYAARIGLVEEINRLLDCQMGVSPGRVVLALILDPLSGRSALFRLEQFFADKDIEHLLGEDIPRSKLNDDTLGLVLDRLSDAGTNTVLGSVVMKVMKSFDLDLSHVHHDTTSRKVYGDYLLYEWECHDHPFVITHGFSKDHRPDLKQLVHSLLCVDHGIPIYSKLLDGNASDKNINRGTLSPRWSSGCVLWGVRISSMSRILP
jgi:Domain of unknown function (DUF4277)